MELSAIKQLLEKYNTGTCSPEEIAILETWYNEQFSDKSTLKLEEVEDAENSMWLKLEKDLVKKSRVKIWPLIVTAASILLVLGIGYYLIWSRNYNPSMVNERAFNNIGPGGNKAFLTLGDGKRISLTDAKNGALAHQSGVIISKTADGQVIYNVSSLSTNNGNGSGNKLVINTIETPNGGTYQVRLPDGTKVWLNAASVLKFPTTFARSLERRVELSGEAYFQVAKDKAHPFIVKSGGQEVRVLGTHFNISAYHDEPTIKTTLLEGSVKVTVRDKSQTLVPGQQAQSSEGIIKLFQKIDTEAVIAWKNGEFSFDNEPLASVMNKVARWYDVDVTYNNVRKSILFSGKVSRYENVTEVLNLLELTGEVHFKIEGRRIIVNK